MRPEELQTMGISPEMASLPLEDLIRHTERRAARAELNGADMGEHTKSPTSQIPEFVLKRSKVTVDHQSVVNKTAR